MCTKGRQRSSARFRKAFRKASARHSARFYILVCPWEKRSGQNHARQLWKRKHYHEPVEKILLLCLITMVNKLPQIIDTKSQVSTKGQQRSSARFPFFHPAPLTALCLSITTYGQQTKSAQAVFEMHLKRLLLCDFDSTATPRKLYFACIRACFAN